MNFEDQFKGGSRLFYRLMGAFLEGTEGFEERARKIIGSPTEPTEEMLDAVRGVLQILRGRPGATFPEVVKHCQMRGDDLSKWPSWIATESGYVTERAAARMIYEIMEAYRGI